MRPGSLTRKSKTSLKVKTQRFHCLLVAKVWIFTHDIAIAVQLYNKHSNSWTKRFV